MDERLTPFEDKMKKSYHNLIEELGTVRAGRANPHVLDKIKVDYYGTPTSLQQVANVSVPEPRMIQIQPWEASLVKEIEKAGIPIVQMCNLVPVAKTVGSNRIVPTISIPYPLGDPGTSKEEQWKLRYHRTKVALESLATDIKEQTVFRV